MSELHATAFCSASHRAFAAAQGSDGGQKPVRAVGGAAERQEAARPVSGAAVTTARAEGANPTDLYETVLIPAAPER